MMIDDVTTGLLKPSEAEKDKTKRQQRTHLTKDTLRRKEKMKV